jgi:hypothetical protein
MSEKECQEFKKDFLLSKFKPEVTLAMAQCMKFKSGVQV